jgi:hypothetical protein
VNKKGVAIGALIGALAGAAAGVYLQKVWNRPIDADDFGMRLAKLEAEIEELEQLQRERKRRAVSGEQGLPPHVTPFPEMRRSAAE